MWLNPDYVSLCCGFSFLKCHMAAASGRNCTRCMGRLLRTLNTTTKPSTRSLFQSLPSSTRVAVATRSFVSSIPLAASIDVTVINVTSLLVHVGGDSTITDMEDDEGNGRAKQRRWALLWISEFQVYVLIESHIPNFIKLRYLCEYYIYQRGEIPICFVLVPLTTIKAQIISCNEILLVVKKQSNHISKIQYILKLK